MDIGGILIALAFGLASAATVWFAALPSFDAKRRTFIASMVFAGWATCNLSHLGGQFQWWIAFDTVMGLTCIIMWRQRRMVWLRHLYYLYILQLALHCIYQTALAFGSNIGYAYVAALNILFLCQLYILGKDGVGRRNHVHSNRSLASSFRRGPNASRVSAQRRRGQ